MREVLLSVGIDIGTSTTSVIFSNITIEDMSSGFSVPRIEIIDKTILYRSPIYFTPLHSATEIDMAAVRDIVEKEYRAAGVDKRDIKTGAVVITGETARKQNAEAVLRHLSDFAGNFVVATAGPTLESIIAGRGAGADVFSKEHSTTAANYDIGGGTSNFVMFDRGHVVATSCLDIGGRLVKVENGAVSYIAPKIAALCADKGIPLQLGARADIHMLERVAAAMCEVLEMSLGLREKSAYYPTALTEPGKDIVLPKPLKNISFSGGVADSIYCDAGREDPLRYGDIGVLLGQAVRASTTLAAIPRFTPAETIRATVVGAGQHITEISGSTIEYDESLLPLKNIPILKLSPAEEDSPATMREAIREKLTWFTVDGELTNAAVAFEGIKSPSFGQVHGIANALLDGLRPLLDAGHPLVAVCENDMAKALGQTIRAAMPGHKGFICIDSVRVDNGDYIDIGSPAGNGNVLPVVVKTMVFK